MNAWLDPRPTLRARLGVFAPYGGPTRPEACEAGTWKVRAGCCDHMGRVTCPLCRRRVPTRPAGRGVVTLERHGTSGP